MIARKSKTRIAENALASTGEKAHKRARVGFGSRVNLGNMNCDAGLNRAVGPDLS